MYISFFAVKGLVDVGSLASVVLDTDVHDGAGRRYGEGEHQVLELRHDVLLLSACEAEARLVALATLAAAAFVCQSILGVSIHGDSTRWPSRAAVRVAGRHLSKCRSEPSG